MSGPTPEAMSPELDRICGELLREPLFHASLGSKELFHSNLLAWLADKYPHEMAGVMAAWSEADPGATHTPTKRETRRLDLVFRLPGRRPLVVENKMFAIPNPGQLIAYDSTIRDEAADASKLLLALMPPGPLPPGWQSATPNRLNSYEPDFAYLYVRCGGITRRQIVVAGLRYLERAEAFIV